MKTFGLVLGMLGLAASACFTPGRGDTVPNTFVGPFSDLGDQVAFDHNCPKERVRLVRRGPAARTVDLDVCGTVRRYRMVENSWLDVTSLYPASSLPAPLPPK